MELSREQYERIKDCLPRQRGNVRIGNLALLNALLYVLEQGCKWRGLPHAFGPWHTIYTRLSRWSKKGGHRAALHPLATGADRGHQARSNRLGQHQHQGASRRHGRTQKKGPQAIGKSRGGWNTKIHLVAASERCALKLALSAGQRGDGPAGRELLLVFGPAPTPGCALLMDCAYQGDETRRLALALGYVPVVPPNPQRREPWEYDRVLYRRRNEVERLFRRLKGFRRVFTRFDKLDVMFTAFIYLALIFDALRLC